MALANNPIHAHNAETDSVIFIGVGINASMFGVKTTVDVPSDTAAGIARSVFPIRHSMRMRFASFETAESGSSFIFVVGSLLGLGHNMLSTDMAVEKIIYR
jgi:hypothetical protein